MAAVTCALAEGHRQQEVRGTDVNCDEQHAQARREDGLVQSTQGSAESITVLALSKTQQNVCGIVHDGVEPSRTGGS
jgi:hypothetical protein